MTGLDIFKEKTYIEVWDGDLNKFVSEFYGRPWHMQQGEELNNESYKIVEVSKEGPDYFTDEEVESKLKTWMEAPVGEGWEATMKFERESYLPVEIILFDLCRRGILPEGQYLITIWW